MQLLTIHINKAALTVVALFGFGVAPTQPKSTEQRQYVEASPVTHVSSDDPPFLLLRGVAQSISQTSNQQVMRNAKHA